MHVITGRFKGVALTTPLSVTRPTTDRTKEAMFSRLESRGLLDDARVLDLFGGTGALGVEALSRGARELVVVEANAQAARLIAQTLTTLKRHSGWEDGMDAHVVRAKAERYAAKAKVDAPFDLVLIDPPYAFPTADCARLLDDLVERGLVADDGAIVLERSKRTKAPTAPAGWVEDDVRDYGETTVYTYRSAAYERLVAEQTAG
ncbi:DNA methyltransferase [Bifidobacterium anseris]|uniref:DNA methyltransferase n=1 Tax=Bifidobacterium anseris TaxID=2020963 RepID=A0A2N5IXY3_9BIFI|nr:16S rRNA (guanine(966)-N(2))-methyltransferase RsmD [Bifidobacterium anseris]PLS26822.1 DNA methyltransferase [Bifidobacterium anseris]